MAIVIGAATTVDFSGACVISASWGYNPNTQRLYCLGSWTPDHTISKPTETLNLTIYAPGPSYQVAPTTSCQDANTIAASVSPAACGGSIGGVSGDWLVTSYGFSKDDAINPGQETWSMQRWKEVSGATVDPTYVMRGVSEGQGTSNAGVTFTGDTASSSTGNVSAGGFGKADSLIIGQVSEVGGGTSAAGETGQGSASMPYTQLYIDT